MGYLKPSAKICVVIATLALVVCTALPAAASPDPTTVELAIRGLEQITVRVTAVGDLQATADNRFALARDMLGPAEIDLEISNSGPSLAFSLIYAGTNPINLDKYNFYYYYEDHRWSTSDEPFATLNKGGK